MLKNLENYLYPTSLEEAIDYLESPHSVAIAGGVNLGVYASDEIHTLIDISRLNLDYIKIENEKVHLGALCNFQQLLIAPQLQVGALRIIPETLKTVVSRPIRNASTLGGNIASALASSDLITTLLALDSRAYLKGVNKERYVPLNEFFKGNRETVLNNELIVEVDFPLPSITSKSCFLKLGRTKFDIALVNIAIIVDWEDNICKDIRIALGSVAPTVIRIPKAEAILKGENWTAELIEKAAEQVFKDVKPIDDIRASADYRREMSKVFTRRALEIVK